MGFLFNFLAPTILSNGTRPNHELGFYSVKTIIFRHSNHFLRRFDSPVLSGPFPCESFAYLFPLFLVYICRCGKMYPDLGSSEKATTAVTIITGVAPVKMYLQIRKKIKLNFHFLAYFQGN